MTVIRFPYIGRTAIGKAQIAAWRSAVIPNNTFCNAQADLIFVNPLKECQEST